MFQKASRKKAKLRLALCAPSGGGKTYTALKIAMGLGGRIAMIDTENRSGELYSHLCDYDVCPIDPPYTPERYMSAIKEAERLGYTTIIIDSLTHAWAGTGGLLEEVDKRKGNGNDFTTWRDITPMHNSLVNAMLQSGCHIIGTMRTKTAYDMVKDPKTGKTKPVKIGLAPIQRDGLEYEFTLVLDLDVDKHIATPSKDRTSLFDGKYFVPDEETGRQLLVWLESGEEPPAPLDMDAIGFAIQTANTMPDLEAIYKTHVDQSKLTGQYNDLNAATIKRKAEIQAMEKRMESESAPMTDNQRKAIMAHYKAMPRDDRLKDMSDFLGRVVTSFTDKETGITKTEAASFIDAISAEKAHPEVA